MWKLLNKEVDVGEPTSFLDQRHNKTYYDPSKWLREVEFIMVEHALRSCVDHSNVNWSCSQHVCMKPPLPVIFYTLLWSTDSLDVWMHSLIQFKKKQCEISKDIVDNYRTMFESQLSAGEQKNFHSVKIFVFLHGLL